MPRPMPVLSRLVRGPLGSLHGAWLAAIAAAGLTALSAGFTPPPMAVADDPTPEQRRQQAVLRVTGPNDGEPINYRILRMTVETSHMGEGTLFVFFNGQYLTRTPLRASAVPGERNLWRMKLDLDLQFVEQFLGIDALAPDAPPVTVGVHLHHTNGGAIAYSEWTGWVGRPWVDVVSPTLERRAVDIPAPEAGGESDEGTFTLTQPALSIHTLGTDIFYVLLAAQSREALQAADPEASDFLQRVFVLATGPCGLTDQVESAQVGLDPLRAAGWKEAHVLLLTYSPEAGWRRSEIVTAAWK